MPGPLLRAGIFVATILAIVALAVLPLLTPWFTHAALDSTNAAAHLGVAPDVAARLSDRSIEELVAGPGDFAFAGPDGRPFYDEAERGHLRDARVLLWLCLGAGGISLAFLVVAILRAAGTRRRALWDVVGRAGLCTALAVVVIGVISLVAFDQVFTLFHQVFFPAGNWAFDPSTQRLVQLYPFAFWQVASGAFGALVLGVGLAAWLLGRRNRREPDVPASAAMPG